MKDAKEIGVYGDLKTFDELLTNGDRLASAILGHCDSKHLKFVRFPFGTNHEELKAVVQYKFSKHGEIGSIDGCIPAQVALSCRSFLALFFNLLERLKLST